MRMKPSKKTKTEAQPQQQPQQQVEHVAISRDTTESDLKQRREFVGGSVAYIDQPVVQARYRLRVK